MCEGIIFNILAVSHGMIEGIRVITNHMFPNNRWQLHCHGQGIRILDSKFPPVINGNLMKMLSREQLRSNISKWFLALNVSLKIGLISVYGRFPVQDFIRYIFRLVFIWALPKLTFEESHKAKLKKTAGTASTTTRPSPSSSSSPWISPARRWAPTRSWPCARSTSLLGSPSCRCCGRSTQSG